MNTQEARTKFLSAVEDDTFYISQVLPFKYTNWIDGMAWFGLLCGAAYKIGDTEVAQACERYLKRLLAVGPDARNFAPEQVTPDWIKSEKVDGFWFKQKPQSFAGPVGLRFAIDNGAYLSDPFRIKSRARWMCRGGWAFGYLVRWISWLQQHVNSMFLAYLIIGEKPASSMLWLCEENPLYSYIAGKKCAVVYPELVRTTGGRSEDVDHVVPMQERKPSSWVFRQWPKSRYIREGEPYPTEYTPTAQLVGDFLQSTL